MRLCDCATVRLCDCAIADKSEAEERGVACRVGSRLNRRDRGSGARACVGLGARRVKGRQKRHSGSGDASNVWCGSTDLELNSAGWLSMANAGPSWAKLGQAGRWDQESDGSTFAG